MKSLDTTLLIDFLRNDADAVSKLKELGDEQLSTTAVNAYELMFGIFLKKQSPQELAAAQSLISSIEVFPLDLLSAGRAALIRAKLIKEGKEISVSDSLVGGILLHNNCSTIVTRDTEHFKRIKGLTAESY